MMVYTVHCVTASWFKSILCLGKSICVEMLIYFPIWLEGIVCDKRCFLKLLSFIDTVIQGCLGYH